jgi:hypothetical protein
LGAASCANVDVTANRRTTAMINRENETQVLRQIEPLIRGLFPGWKNRNGSGLLFRLMQRLGKPFFQFIRGNSFLGGEPSPRKSPTTRFQFIAFPITAAAWREVLSRRQNPRTGNPWSEPPKAGHRVVEASRCGVASRGSRNTPLFMVTEGTLANARESRAVFRDGKCRSNKRTY